MGGARALIASLGASISLVAGAAVSLLLFSVVFALPGFTGGDDETGARPAVVVDSRVSRARSERAATEREASTALLIAAPEPARTTARPATSRASGVRSEATADKPAFNPDVRDLGPAPPPPAAPGPTASKPAIGDGVRDVGDAVTATVQGTGKAATPLLGPPVSQAIQDVLDLLSSVLAGTTGALGGVLDKTVPR